MTKRKVKVKCFLNGNGDSEGVEGPRGPTGSGSTGATGDTGMQGDDGDQGPTIGFEATYGQLWSGTQPMGANTTITYQVEGPFANIVGSSLNGTMTIQDTGIYLVSFDSTVRTSLDETWSFILYKNGSPNFAKSSQSFFNVLTDHEKTGFAYIDQLNSGDNISVFAETTATTTLDTLGVFFIAERIG